MTDQSTDNESKQVTIKEQFLTIYNDFMEHAMIYGFPCGVVSGMIMSHNKSNMEQFYYSILTGAITHLSFNLQRLLPLFFPSMVFSFFGVKLFRHIGAKTSWFK